jgi:hypothetical protein
MELIIILFSLRLEGLLAKYNLNLRAAMITFN